MNARQAAKLAAKRIEELEHISAQQVKEIQDHDAAMQAVIAGASPCDWCEEARLGDCTAPEKGGKGCSEWWLRFREDSPIKAALEAAKREAEERAGETVLSGRPSRGE